MIYKNIEVHNVEELIPCEDGGVRWLRVPRHVYDKLDRDSGRKMATECTGVELRFVLKGDKAVIRLKSRSTPNTVTTCHVYHGGMQGGWHKHELNGYIPTTGCAIEFTKPANLETLKKISTETGLDWDPEVFRLIFSWGEYQVLDVEGDVAPPAPWQTPRKTLMAYGSSVTHGSNAITASDTWVSVLAHNLNVDFRNLGMAGSCCMEPEMVDYIAAEGEAGRWDLATLELGANVLKWEEDQIRDRAGNALRQIAGRNPSKPIFVISPFYIHDDYRKAGNADRWRRVLPQIVKELNFPNVVLFNGLDLLGDVSLLSADIVHPSLYGSRQIAQRLTDQILEHLPKLEAALG